MNKDFRANLSQLKKRAFTLAETLIVMGIIGVVAALTLPNLNSSTGEKEKVTKLQKIYSNLQDAFGRAVAVYGPLDEWCTNVSEDCSKKVGERITEFMKVSKVCGLETNKGCFSDKSYFMDKSGYDDGEDTYDNEYKVILADGTSLSFGFMDAELGYVFFDIDGPNKGDSTYNKDLFLFEYDKKGELVPSGSGSSGDYNPYHFLYGYAGTAWIIQNGNMDYLKVGSDGKCPDGIKLNWTTKTTCK